MLSRIRTVTLSWAMIAALVLQMAVPPALAQETLPRPEPTFKGKIGITYQDSQPDTALFQAAKAPDGAPNVLLVLIDDAGFGSASTFGGPIATPTFDRLAANGLRYNTFHTTALCSPTRAAMLTGRNHHSVGSAPLQEGHGLSGLYRGDSPQCGHLWANFAGLRL
jgi:hypothetical protein